ncbi:MAG: hypothetical protein JRH16_21130 [Deltaproteobacteria bacterium]|nr:hypothetical protein [Deltaproteobacteria bacterium]MBW2362656.1 hypothetical protein [Deltaproteobacteria bacterium]
MKSLIGRKNILFGLAYFLTTLGLGMFMAWKGQAVDPEWEESMAKQLLGVAHSHGNLEALLNIVFGYLICRLAEPSLMLAKVASVLLIVGAVLHSGTFYLGGAGLSFVLNITPVGGFSVAAGVALMIPIVAKGIPGDG